LIDLALLLGLCLALFLGVVEGAIRRLLGIASTLMAFLLAANLRDALGDYLSGNWAQFDVGYDRLLAFILLFAFFLIVATILTQVFYKRTDLSTAHPLIEDAAGGLLGVLEGLVLLTVAVVILNSYQLPAARPGDLGPLRDAQRMLVQESHIGTGIRDHVASPVVHVLAPLLPSDVVSVYP
jgi:uncharacterized membrane protein required for colicin V production